MSILEIDLRGAGTSCKEHPLVLLIKMISEGYERNIQQLKIYFYSEDLSLGILNLIISRYGYKIDEITTLNSKTTCVKAVRESS